MDEDQASVKFSQTALEYIDSLYGYAMTLTHDHMEAEDLLQETYLRAVRAAEHLESKSNIKGWLFVIMRNAWLNHLRHIQSGPRFLELDREEVLQHWPDQRALDPHLTYLRKLERDEVKAAIDKLPGLYREIIILRDVEGFTYQEIATMLGCPAGTVMSRLGRARDKLRKLLAGWRPVKAARAG
jgi:RNA polymerase sigma-70 factor (ECF subfamily)